MPIKIFSASKIDAKKGCALQQKWEEKQKSLNRDGKQKTASSLGRPGQCTQLATKVSVWKARQGAP
jgi:hypothetical protein